MAALLLNLSNPANSVLPSCFIVDKQRGLVSMANTNRALNLNQTTPATGPAGSVSHIVFSEDGKTLVASVKGVPPTPGFLAAWAVQQDGSLSTDFQRLRQPMSSLERTPSSLRTLALGSTSSILVVKPILLSRSTASQRRVGRALAKDWNFYLTDIGTSIVTEVNVDDNLKGTIVKVRNLIAKILRSEKLTVFIIQQYAQGQGTATIDNDIVTVGNNESVVFARVTYVRTLTLQPVSSNATTIDVLALNAPGQAQTIQKLGVAQTAQRVNLKLILEGKVVDFRNDRSPSKPSSKLGSQLALQGEIDAFYTEEAKRWIRYCIYIVRRQCKESRHYVTVCEKEFFNSVAIGEPEHLRSNVHICECRRPKVIEILAKSGSLPNQVDQRRPSEGARSRREIEALQQRHAL
ncbi:3-carboxymuconate cyclase [Salix suchowensis]|nr:3-carboxymuconate cyclase [Salix suchowensis]